ncbi:hypothetical protein AX16_001675 [Volvariella volvacea WC 439]|nr:hypothetical protein AX16_001675 [Volvariella volvacea WC 439]
MISASLPEPVAKGRKGGLIWLLESTGQLPTTPHVVSTEIQQPPEPTEVTDNPFKYKCFHPYCTFTARQRAKLNNHLATHTGDQPFRCVICKKQYSAVSTLAKHQKDNHPQVVFVDANGQDTNKRWTNPVKNPLMEVYLNVSRTLWDFLVKGRLHVEVLDEAYSVSTEDGVTTVTWLDFGRPSTPTSIDAAPSLLYNGRPIANYSGYIPRATANNNATSRVNVAVPVPEFHSHGARGSAYPSSPGTTGTSTPVPSAGTSARSSVGHITSVEPSAPLPVPPVVPSDGRRTYRRPIVHQMGVLAVPALAPFSQFNRWITGDTTEKLAGKAEMSDYSSTPTNGVGGMANHQAQAQPQPPARVGGRRGLSGNRNGNERTEGARQQVPPMPPPTQPAPSQQQQPEEEPVQPTQAPESAQPQQQSRKRRRVDTDIEPKRNFYPNINDSGTSESNVISAASTSSGAVHTQVDLFKGGLSVSEYPLTSGQVVNAASILASTNTDGANDDTTNTDNHIPTIPVTATTYAPAHIYTVSNIASYNAINTNTGIVLNNSTLNVNNINPTPPIEYSHPYQFHPTPEGVITQPGNSTHQVAVDQGYVAVPQLQPIHNPNIQYYPNMQNRQYNHDRQYNPNEGYFLSLPSFPTSPNGYNGANTSVFMNYADNLEPTNNETVQVTFTDEEIDMFSNMESRRLGGGVEFLEGFVYPDSHRYPPADGGVDDVWSD